MNTMNTTATNRTDAFNIVVAHFGNPTASTAYLAEFFTTALVDGRATFCSECTFPLFTGDRCQVCGAVPAALETLRTNQEDEATGRYVALYADEVMRISAMQVSRNEYGRHLFLVQDQAAWAAEAVAVSRLAVGTDIEPVAEIDGGF